MARKGDITKCLVGLLQRVLLNHAVNVLQLRKRDRLFTVCNMTGWPANDGKSLANLRRIELATAFDLSQFRSWKNTYQGDSIDRDLARGYCNNVRTWVFHDLRSIGLTGKNEQFPKHTQTAYQGFNDISVRCCRNNQRSASKLLQRLGRIDLGGVNILMSTQLSSKLLLFGATRQCDYAPAKLVGVLNGQVPEAADTLDSDGCAWFDVHATHGGENGHACAEDGRIFRCIDVFWHADDSFAMQFAVFGVLVRRLD